MPDTATAIVPATSANLGCAFDCAALALNLYLRVRATRNPHRFEIVYQGPRPESIPSDDSNLVVRGIRAVAEWGGTAVPTARIEIDNEIPVGSGLGSSAAAIVVGILVGARICGVSPSADTIIRLAAGIEGHPDNVAAAYCGGLVVCAQRENSGDVLTLKAEVPQDLEFIAVIPAIGMPTAQSRAVLPSAYSRADVVHNLQRTALFVASVFSGRFDLQPEFFRDRLHQPYRCSLIPGLEECLKLSHPDLIGVLLSGAGSAVLAIARKNAAEVAALLVAEFNRHGVAAQPLFLKAENRGARDSSAAGSAGS